ncbi:galactokinase [Mycobacterium montefiorense]|uniref:Galactokinase n=1 Tax=Mycobacterium montefiorense TaxID=154654 RepID=A0AA37PPI2_9MYCO|nr:galactokinase [Mycobacterium montefiorense]GBG40685.1 galactokinase [Mycobacterium montefiorense]GKU33334.1 galactokinase [Mycobacterium montefiorense]GKU41738.1 galactokinase [Mycobacterium montefiorense]GKU44868.1 galactokinase [Mycobacterium montefiorense]GKU52162.1 galactokinase [Mycobacterium montefiorense]
MTIRYAAPGRINLIGEHTDYNLGFALPIALPQRTVVTFTPDRGDAITVSSDRADGAVRIPLSTAPGDLDGWASYVAGVMWTLRQAGHPVPGGAMSITSEVELGSGLSSSAALECAALGAIASAAGVHIDAKEQARLAQRAENDYVGAPTGLLDQLSALFGAPSTALLIDFRDATVEPVAFDPDAHGVALLLIDSRARHRHAGGEYAARRASCERAAAELKVSSLREVQDHGPSVLAAVTDPVDARRARHVLTENRRVLDFVGTLRDSDFTAAGQIMTASHASMRDDFEITIGHIDLIADTAVRAGALGARMTGGGFGGCVIALVPTDQAEAVGEAVRHAVTDAGFEQPVISRTRAGTGAGPA